MLVESSDCVLHIQCHLRVVIMLLLGAADCHCVHVAASVLVWCGCNVRVLQTSRIQALLRHEVLVGKLNRRLGCPCSRTLLDTSASSCRHCAGTTLRQATSLLRYRPLVKIARLKELVCRWKPVLLLVLLSGGLVATLLHVGEVIVGLACAERATWPWLRGPLRRSVSHLLDVRSELLSRSYLEWRRAEISGRRLITEASLTQIAYSGTSTTCSKLPIETALHLVGGAWLVRLAHLVGASIATGTSIVR